MFLRPLLVCRHEMRAAVVLIALALVVTCEAKFNVNVTVYQSSLCSQKQPQVSFIIPEATCHTFTLGNITNSLKVYCQASSTTANWILCAKLLLPLTDLISADLQRIGSARQVALALQR